MNENELKIRANEAPVNLVDYLSKRLRCSLRKAKTMLDERRVFVNRRRVWMAKHTLKAGDIVEIAGDAPADKPAPIKLTVLAQDADYLIINKPAGLLSNGSNSAESMLRVQLGDRIITAVHRLDRDTSGCLLFSKSTAAHDAAVACFREQRVTKVYQAIVSGELRKSAGTVRQEIEERDAITHVRVLSSNPVASHVQIKIDTGRTHQIRKHLTAIGHPVLGDKQYLTRKIDDARMRTIPRQMLHAATLQLNLPNTPTPLRARAPQPRDYKNCLKRLRLT